MTKNFEIENRPRHSGTLESPLMRRIDYEYVFEAEMVAWIRRTYCSVGQDVSYETLKKDYFDLTGKEL